MRTNLPVTQHECVLRDDIAIISHTDSKGTIRFCNDDFVEVSGYAREELIGQPHNILRHPDMPAEAFRDLWATVKSGRPWTGMVKNRCKNGDHYWVRATVTPGLDGGYVSVRSKATSDEINAAQALYARMVQGEVVRFREGRVLPAGLRGCVTRALERCDDMGVAGMLAFVLVASMLPFAALLVYALWVQGEAELRLADAGLAAAVQAEVSGLFASAHLWAVAVGGATVAFAVGAATLFATRAQRRAREAHTLLRGLGRGELKQKVFAGARDEVGECLTAAIVLRNSVYEAVALMHQSARRLTASSHELNAVNQRAVGASENQSSAMVAVATAIEELSASINQVSDSAGVAVEAGRESSHAAEQSAGAVHEVAGSIDQAARAVAQTETRMAELAKQSAQVSHVVNLIRDIAEQTNLLALNAAIEAARAGEQGRGFAVVADEVGRLAERTAHSTHEIASSIASIQHIASEVAEEVVASSAQVRLGAEKALSAGDAVARICELAARADGAMAEIHEALLEQGHVAHDVAEHVEKVSTLAENGLEEARLSEAVATTVSGYGQRLEVISARFQL